MVSAVGAARRCATFRGGARWGAFGGIVLLAACAGGSDLGSWDDVPQQRAGALKVIVDPARSELVLELPPVDLPAHTGHHGGGDQPPTQYGVIPVSGWLHGYDVELVDKTGRQIPRELLHHVNIIAPDRRELFSPIMQRIGAAGTETSPVHLPRLLGYPVGRGDRIVLAGMLHNPGDESYEAVRIRVRLPLTSTRRWIDPIRVYPFYLDVMPPASVHRFDLPPGRSEQSWEGRPAVSGRILGMGGHLHRYAVALRFQDVTTGKVLWETSPVLDESGEVEGMPQHRLWWRLGIPIDAQHTYRLTAIYENPTSEMIPDGGMGALGGIILPARGTVWPGVDPSNEEYRLDVRLTEAGARATELMSGTLDATQAPPSRSHTHPAPHIH